MDELLTIINLRIALVIFALIPFIIALVNKKRIIFTFFFFSLVFIYQSVKILNFESTPYLNPVLITTWVILSIFIITIVVLRLRLNKILSKRLTGAYFIEFLYSLIRIPDIIIEAISDRKRFRIANRIEKAKKVKKILTREEKIKRYKKLVLIVVFAVAVIGSNILAKIYLSTGEGLEIHVFPRPVEGLEQYGITETNVSMWVLTSILLAVALLIRFRFIPEFKEIPDKLQMIIELIVGGLENYAHKVAETKDKVVSSFGLTVAAVIVTSGFVELLGLRAPTTDIMLTASLAVLALVVINIAGIKKHGFFGRFKSFFHPEPLVGPIMIVMNLLIPVSLTFRLFGNILGGMIVLELVYAVTSVFIPGILDTFFVLFHAGMQTYVFLTLMFTFVGEAVED